MAALTNQVIVRDKFTRANAGTLGANWTALSDATNTATVGITSNSAEVQTTGGNSASFWSANGFSADQYSQCNINGSAVGSGSQSAFPIVRGSAAGCYRFFANTNNAALNLQIAKIVGGVFTQVGSQATRTLASGDLLRLEIVGTTLTAYVNGVQVIQATDSALSSGAPGVGGFMSAASPTAFATNFEGGNLVWTRQGTVIAKTVGNGGGAQEPSVLYDTNPQILSANADGKIFKMWYTNGWTNPVVINYAESNNGTSWTQFGSNPVINNGTNNSLHSFVFRNGNIYYAFVGNDLGANAGNTNQFDLWQSSNGVTGWTLTNSSILSVGGAGTFDASGIADPVVFVQGTTWFMLYQGKAVSGIYAVGLATSPDGKVWTKYAGNPVITGVGDALNGKTVVLVNGTYYLWGGTSPSGSVLPTDIAMWSSPDLHVWTAVANNPIYIRVLSDEGPNLASGQVADASLVEVSGTTYLFYDAIDVQAAGNIHINLATSPFTMLQTIQIVSGLQTAGLSGNAIAITGSMPSPVVIGGSNNFNLVWVWGSATDSFTLKDGNGNVLLTEAGITTEATGMWACPVTIKAVKGFQVTSISVTGSGALYIYPQQ